MKKQTACNTVEQEPKSITDFILKLCSTENSIVIVGDREVSLRSSSEQPAGKCQMRLAPAANRTSHAGSVTSGRNS